MIKDGLGMFNPIKDGPFRGYPQMGCKKAPSLKSTTPHIYCSDETWFSYTLMLFLLDLQSWKLNCRLSLYLDPLPLKNLAGVQRAAMVNVNSSETLFGGRGVKVCGIIVQDCLNSLNFRSLDYTLKN